MPEPEYVKVRFRLEQDEDGWPPFESEGLWAVPAGKNHYRLENTPWFARGVAVEDIWSATVSEDGVLWADEQVAWSGHCTIRIIPLADGPLHGSQQAVIDKMVELGASAEGFGEKINIVAVSIPNGSDFPAIKAVLQSNTANGSWEYEEGCISQEWEAA
jgi:hypothetical protein